MSLSPTALLREPLLQFLAIGVVLFALQAIFADRRPSETVIRVDATVQARLAEGFEASTARAPTEEELRRLIDGWVLEEALYRHGLALGLDQSDAYVRERVIALTRAVLRRTAGGSEPSPDALAAFFAAEAERYRAPRLYDIDQAMLRGDNAETRAAAEALLDQLRQGARPEEIGHRFIRTERRTERQLEAIFGADLAAQITAAPAGNWQLLRSARGWHVMHVDIADPGGMPTLDEVRDRVRDDWRQAEAHRAIARQLGDIRAGYDVELE